MRSWCALALTLFTTAAHADEAPIDAYASVELVGIMIETRQCLLWDEAANEYRVARMGEQVNGWKIVALEEGRVVLTQGTERDELLLVSDTTTVRPATPTREKLPVMVIAQGKVAQPKVIEPKVITPDVKPLPDPEVKKKVETPKEKVETKVVKPKAETETVKKTLRRSDVDRELADFDRVLAALQVEKAAAGGFNITYLNDSSWFYKIGLRQGDHVQTIAGLEVSSVDAAAKLYAKLGSMNAIDVVLERGGQKVILKYAIR